MAPSFVSFALLPFEIRHTIWEMALPTTDADHMSYFLKSIAQLILSQPRDAYFRNGVNAKYDSTIINDFVRDLPSPFAAFAACTESKVVAFKHLRRLLLNQKDLKAWFTTPKFPYNNPELVVCKKEGKLVYRCEKITEGFELEKFVFWEFVKPMPKRKSLPYFATIAEYDKWNDQRILDSLEKMRREDEEIAAAENGITGEMEFWEVENGSTTDIEGDECLPWDDESETEGDDVQSLLPKPVTKTENGIACIKRERSRDDETTIGEDTESSRKRRKCFLE